MGCCVNGHIKCCVHAYIESSMHTLKNCIFMHVLDAVFMVILCGLRLSEEGICIPLQISTYTCGEKINWLTDPFVKMANWLDGHTNQSCAGAGPKGERSEPRDACIY